MDTSRLLTEVWWRREPDPQSSSIYRCRYTWWGSEKLLYCYCCYGFDILDLTMMIHTTYAVLCVLCDHCFCCCNSKCFVWLVICCHFAGASFHGRARPHTPFNFRQQQEAAVVIACRFVWPLLLVNRKDVCVRAHDEYISWCWVVMNHSTFCILIHNTNKDAADEWNIVMILYNTF